MQPNHIAGSPMNATGTNERFDRPVADWLLEYERVLADRDVVGEELDRFHGADFVPQVPLRNFATAGYPAKDMSERVFICVSDVHRYFEPLENLGIDFRLDKLKILQEFARQAQREYEAKLASGYYDNHAHYELLCQQLDVIEGHICNLPCKDLADVQAKVRFALEHETCDDTGWTSRDEILKSIFEFAVVASQGKPDVSIQVAALKQFTERLHESE